MIMYRSEFPRVWSSSLMEKVAESESTADRRVILSAWRSEDIGKPVVSEMGSIMAMLGNYVYLD